MENAQEGKTKFIQHWKFTKISDMNASLGLKYVEEAIENQKKSATVIKKNGRTTTLQGAFSEK